MFKDKLNAVGNKVIGIFDVQREKVLVGITKDVKLNWITQRLDSARSIINAVGFENVSDEHEDFFETLYKKSRRYYRERFISSLTEYERGIFEGITGAPIDFPDVIIESDNIVRELANKNADSVDFLDKVIVNHDRKQPDRSVTCASLISNESYILPILNNFGGLGTIGDLIDVMDKVLINSMRNEYSELSEHKNYSKDFIGVKNETKI